MPLDQTPYLSFREYINKVCPEFYWYKDCEVVANVLQKVANGEIKRLMVFKPPRRSKSKQISELFSSYFLYRYPSRWASINSYSAAVSSLFAKDARRYYEKTGGKTKGNRHWETPEGGGIFAAGVGGPSVGMRWHLGIIDSPAGNANERDSSSISKQHKEWYTYTFCPRAEHGAIILVTDYMIEGSLASWLLDKEKSKDEQQHWHIVSLEEEIKGSDSVIYPSTCTVEPDWRQEGEALRPLLSVSLSSH